MKNVPIYTEVCTRSTLSTHLSTLANTYITGIFSPEVRWLTSYFPFRFCLLWTPLDFSQAKAVALSVSLSHFVSLCLCVSLQRTWMTWGWRGSLAWFLLAVSSAKGAAPTAPNRRPKSPLTSAQGVPGKYLPSEQPLVPSLPVCAHSHIHLLSFCLASQPQCTHTPHQLATRKHTY